jgi:CRP-like cAMP-binding protein
MLAYLELLQKTELFAHFTPDEMRRLLPLLNPAVHEYPNGHCLLPAGHEADAMGVVLSGGIEASKLTRAGEEFTVMRMGPGGVFGDVLSGSGRKSPVRVCATVPVRVLLLPRARLFAPPAQEPALFHRLLCNLVTVASNKYFALDERIDLLLIRGLRARIAAFLSARQPTGAAGEWFELPLGRAALAAHLGCERSALSRELSRMVKDGLIAVQGRRFRMIESDSFWDLF